MKNTATHRIAAAGALLTLLLSGAARADDWRIVTAPAELPQAEQQGYTATGGARIHYKLYGLNHDQAIVLLHGGMGASEDFGGQIDALARSHKVVAIDTRGHGRSSQGDVAIDYHRMALDVVAVMDELDIPSAAFVGWSAGGVIGLELGMDHPQRVDSLFLIGTYYAVSGSRSPESVSNDRLHLAYMAHAERQYLALSDAPENYDDFSAIMFDLWMAEPNYSAEQLAAIAAPTMIAHAPYDEYIQEQHARQLARLIPNAEFWLIDNASHFAMWQQPKRISNAILDFVKRAGFN